MKIKIKLAIRDPGDESSCTIRLPTLKVPVKNVAIKSSGDHDGRWEFDWLQGDKFIGNSIDDPLSRLVFKDVLPSDLFQSIDGNTTTGHCRVDKLFDPRIRFIHSSGLDLSDISSITITYSL